MKIEIENETISFTERITIEEAISASDYPKKDYLVAVKINNTVYDLNHYIEENMVIEPVTIESELGNRIYRRSLFIVLAKAIYELYPSGRLSIEHSLSNGIYCELHKDGPISNNDLNQIKNKMDDIIDRDLPIIRKKHFREDAIKLLEMQDHCSARISLIKNLNLDYYPLYELAGYYDYFYYNLVPRTGYLHKFDLHLRIPGFILLFPNFFEKDEVPSFIEQPKLASVFQEYENLGNIIGVENVVDLNELIQENNYGELIRIAEGLHEKKIANIADQINKDLPRRKIILIAGPSSSGKTTFTDRLATQLRINGLRPISISIDNYFVDRDDTPLDEDGNYNFEALEAIDLELFNNHLMRLVQGEEVEIPFFNFAKGHREYIGKKIKIEEDQPILIEGIHGLNDKLTEMIPQDLKFKIYVSSLTQLNIDCHNRIPTTDTRLIRRIVRDNLYRGQTASGTLDLWSSVRKGEEKNIFPYQENANVMFNSALIYELSVLKVYAEPLLKKIDRTDENYYQAQRLLEILACFTEMPSNEIPPTSILKEFIGDSVYR